MMNSKRIKNYFLLTKEEIKFEGTRHSKEETLKLKIENEIYFKIKKNILKKFNPNKFLPNNQL
jgi:hypothetical protein